MGFQVDARGGVRYREWAPGVTEARFIGDFSALLTAVQSLMLITQTTGHTQRIQ